MMSIMIKNLEMPTCCWDCPIQVNPFCAANDIIDLDERTKRPDKCPLTKVPEDVQPVVRCKDCVYRPYYEPSDSKSASDLVFPDYRFNLCPCQVEDFWYSWMPDDDWFCAYGKRKDGENDT